MAADWLDVSRCSHFLCRAASYSTMLPATPAFNDSTCGVCGIATSSSTCAIKLRAKPDPSLPINTAAGPVSLEEVAAAAERWRQRRQEAEEARRLLRRLMVAALEQGASVAEVARAAGVTWARVWQIRQIRQGGER